MLPCFIVLLMTLLLESSSADGHILPFHLEHSFDLKTFYPRTSFEISLQGEVVSASIVGENQILDDQVEHLKVSSSLSTFCIHMMQSLLASNGLYRIRFRSSSNNESSPYISTAIRAVS